MLERSVLGHVAVGVTHRAVTSANSAAVKPLASDSGAGEHARWKKTRVRMRRTICWFCGLLLSACYVEAGNVAAQETPAAQSTANARAVKPLIIPTFKAPLQSVSKPALKSNKAPAKPAAKSTRAAQSNPSTKAAQAAKSLPTKAKPVRSNAARTKLAPLKLNLNLPPELVENIEFGKPLAEVDEVPVLPPMFGEAKPAPSAYQLSGKLISNERQKQDSDNYLDSVEGAELSIEFRH
jgi:hypothetical protein